MTDYYSLKHKLNYKPLIYLIKLFGCQYCSIFSRVGRSPKYNSTSKKFQRYWQPNRLISYLLYDISIFRWLICILNYQCHKTGKLCRADSGSKILLTRTQLTAAAKLYTKNSVIFIVGICSCCRCAGLMLCLADGQWSYSVLVFCFPCFHSWLVYLTWLQYPSVAGWTKSNKCPQI